MPNYANGKIYCIRNRADTDRIVYIGSTVRPLSERMSKHRSTIKIKPDIKIYKLMAEVGVDNFHIELIANFPCENVEQLLAEEGRHIRLNDTINKGVNSDMAGRSQKQHYEDNREAIREVAKEKYHENIDAIRERDRERYAADKATFAARNLEYRQRNAERLQAYADAHKERTAAKNKAYHAAHRDEINARKQAQRAERRRLAEAGAVVVDA